MAVGSIACVPRGTLTRRVGVDGTLLIALTVPPDCCVAAPDLHDREPSCVTPWSSVPDGTAPREVIVANTYPRTHRVDNNLTAHKLLHGYEPPDLCCDIS